MHGLDQFDDNDDGTIFRDVIMLALLGFVSIVVLLLPHLNPPDEKGDPSKLPGNVVVELSWPNQLNTDIDLWVEAPGGVPVGYSNKGDRLFNLLRDDLGQAGDTTDINYEVAYSRGLPVGEYTVNLHLYSNIAGTLPIPAMVSVGVKASPEADVRHIATRRVELSHVGQELTVVRFSLNEKGAVVVGSVHDLQRPLRTARR